MFKSFTVIVALWTGTIYSSEYSDLLCSILTGVAASVTVMALIYSVYRMGYKECLEEFLNADGIPTPRFEDLPYEIQQFLIEQKRGEHHNK